MDEHLTMYDYALNYASNYNFCVFPCQIDKNPHTPRGYLDAKTEQRAIKHWWKTKWPDANIGIACEQSNLLVIDVDRDDDTGVDGFQSLKQWEKEQGVKLPETVTAITGRGGMHLYYRFEYTGMNSDPRNRTGVLEGVDVRANGYVIAPPSQHANGNYYQWEISPDDEEIAYADDAVLKLCRFGFIDNGKTEPTTIPDEPISQGSRNATLYKIGCSLQARGFSDSLIKTNLQSINQEKCDPPIEDAELERIVQSVFKHPKNEMRTYFDDMDKRDPVIQRNSKGNVIQSIPNAVEAIQYDDALYRRILFNELSGSIYVYGILPWDLDADNSMGKREWKNVDDSNLIAYLQDHYGLMSEKSIMHGLSIVANKYKYNPIKEHLEACKGLYQSGDCIRKLLPKYLGVEDSDYAYEVMRLFMLGAICRIYNPGCKFDYMPIIVGEQGCGKSAFLRMLAVKPEWFTDNFNTLDGDKASEKLRGLWILEVAELSAMKRSKDVETIKAFVTSTSDNYRSPYSRRTENRPRMCVFAGTTNDESFLTDTTGNRRFLPLVASKQRQQVMILDAPEEAQQDIALAWGEAMTEYESYINQNRFPDLVLPKSVQEEAERMQIKFLEEDVRIPIIQEWLDKNAPNRVCVPMIYEYALNGDIKDLSSKKLSNEIHRILRNSISGWKCVDRQRCEKYGVIVSYEREN